MKESKPIRIIEDWPSTERVLWRTSGFLQALAGDLKYLAPDRAKACREFADCLEKEASKLNISPPQV